MRTFLADNINDLDGRQWDQLAALSPTRSVFQSFGWHQAWWETFSENKKLFLICIEENGKLCGVAPLFLSFKGRRRVLKFIGSGNSDYCDFIYFDDRPEILAKMLDFLVINKDRWDQAVLDYIPQKSPTVVQLSSAFSLHQLYPYAYSRIVCPVLLVDSDGKNISEILQKKILKRRYNYFFKKEGYEVLHLTREEEILPCLNEFFEQHIRRRGRTASPSLFLNQTNREFYKNLLTRLCPHKQIIFSVIKSGGQAIAFHFGFINYKIFLWYKPSFEITHASHSPGMVLIKEILEYVLSQGIREVDFTIGKEPFKMDFANYMRENFSFKIYKTSWDYRLGKALGAVKRTMS
ncbi:MAG: GNAT family N-acetyltransferase [Candidatus Omnitrophica bacterium]|nr:GNAT family N-acetyltransferase [Candidatus Omnitrophota bacterium]